MKNNDLLMKVKDLRTVFRTDEGLVKAVNGVSFDLYKRESLGIVGESGCGKSVTNLSIMGLIPQPPGKIVGGNIDFEGKEILRIKEKEKRKIRGKNISMIFQDPMTSLNPFMRISDQMIESLELHLNMNKNEALGRAVDMLDLVGIPNPKKRVFSYPHEFSGGMRQRVMIAMALSTDPKLLIADEPTTALDVTIQAQILEIIKELQNKIHMSLILITHDLGVVAGMTDRTIVMYAGHIVEENTTDELFSYPRHPYTRGLLDSVPSIDQQPKEELYTIKGSPPNLVELPDECPFHPRCPKAKPKCREKMPPLEKTSKTGEVACYFPN
jgi:oligopeptide/dipeptide ABC transporter ATP-binding protein